MYPAMITYSTHDVSTRRSAPVGARHASCTSTSSLSTPPNFNSHYIMKTRSTTFLLAFVLLFGLTACDSVTGDDDSYEINGTWEQSFDNETAYLDLDVPESTFYYPSFGSDTTSATCYTTDDGHVEPLEGDLYRVYEDDIADADTVSLHVENDLLHINDGEELWHPSDQSVSSLQICQE